MNRWLALELEKLVEINKTPHSAKWQTTPPFVYLIMMENY